MHYVIDGHNLIGTNRLGFTLSDLDDEERLIGLLNTFARVSRNKVEVFFDHAPANQAGVRKSGTVAAHFIRTGIPADDAIRDYLSRLGPRARQITLVSSDNQVRANGRAAGAKLVASEEFAGTLLAAMELSQMRTTHEDGPAMSDEELERWMQEFSKGRPT